MLRSFKQLGSEPDTPMTPFQGDMADWFADQHPVLMKQGLGGAAR